MHDGHRMGALRFRMGDRVLDDDDVLASPPWTSLRELEQASLELEREGVEDDPDYGRWLRMLIAPGGSLGGARAHHTFLSRRFDRTDGGGRLHFASAMTLLDRTDGEAADDGVSYAELAELLMRVGSKTSSDLEQLWRRIVFFMCVSNTDDHLRNHGFMLEPNGWALAPAYDMNPDPHGAGLRLNVSETDNAQDLELALSVASVFRVKPKRAQAIAFEVKGVVAGWRAVASSHGLTRAAQDRMQRAFRVAEGQPGPRAKTAGST